jgi:hypothetical protein
VLNHFAFLGETALGGDALLCVSHSQSTLDQFPRETAIAGKNYLKKKWGWASVSSGRERLASTGS